MREEEKRQRIAEAHEDEHDSETTGKRKASAAEVRVEKKRRVEETAIRNQSFPQDFFSDPTQAPIPLSEGESDEEVEDGAPTQHLPPSTEVDLEYQRFQLELLKNADPSETYDRATVVAEPVLASTDIPGFPTNADEAASTQVREEQTRSKREQEDRELIMDRLLEEERAQEDADMRVQLLKTKLEGLRKKREATRSTIK
jgi:zinc finger protein 830